MRYDPAALDEIEKRLWRDIWSAAVDIAVEEMGIELVGFGPVQASVVAEGFDDPMLNLVLGAAAPGAVETGRLAAAIEWMQSLGVHYRVPVTPGRPAAKLAEEWLLASGHELGATWVKAVRDVSPLPLAQQQGVEVLKREADEDESFGDPFAEALGMPDWTSSLFLDLPGTEGWHCHVAVHGDDALAHAAMLVHAGVAELLLGANPGAASERHGEGQMALLHRCIGEAAAAGCEAVFAETLEFDPEPLSNSRESLQRAGFEPAFVRRDWHPPREAVAGARGNSLWDEV